jgi:hypothetical protein
MSRSSAEFQGILRVDSIAIILAGATLSNAVDLHGTSLVGISVPSSFSGSQLSIYSAISFDGVYRVVKNINGTAATMTCVANEHIALVPFDLASVRFIKVLSDVSQGGDCEITLITRPV